MFDLKKIKLAIQLAVQGLKTNRLRTILTTVGIVIGISTVIIVLAAGRGLETYIIKQMEIFGSDTIEIEIKLPSTSDVEMMSAMIGGAEVTTLKKEDFEAVKTLENVDEYYAAILGEFKTVYKNKNVSATILATTAGEPAIEPDLKMQQGRFFTEKEDRAVAKVAILGSEIKEDLFGAEDAIGKNIKINQVSFKVIGIAESRGAAFYFSYDKMIYVPLKTAQKLLLGIEHVLYGFVSVHDTTRVKETVAEMITIMERRHGIPPGNEKKHDFRVTSMQEAMEIMGTVTFAITLLVLGVAGISLLVGGVGIMNIMYLTVLERTREIGLRKALGAPNSLIQAQFLYEAIIITGLGGLVGIALGWVIVTLIGFAASLQGFNFDLGVSLDAVLVGLGASLFFGVIFGLYPARKAASLSPVEALRWE
ncbi:ABC transporter permease [Patescibacteria group bacterium]